MTRHGTTEQGTVGPILGEGRTAVVHDLGDGRVLRRYRDPRADAAREARFMSLAAAHGVPVPRVLGADGPDLVMERIDGPSMLDVLLDEPDAADGHGRILAALHRSLDAVPAPPGRLLHGDLHPGNVLLGPAGPVLVDWTNAGAGPAAQDVAVTWLVLACFEPHRSSGGAGWDVVRRRLLDAFLADVDRTAAAAAVPAVAARRLSDRSTSTKERALITEFARRISDGEEWRRGESNP